MIPPRRAARSATRLPLALLGMTYVAAACTPAAGGWVVLAGLAAAIGAGIACIAVLDRRHRAELLAERAHARGAQQRLVAGLLDTHARQRDVLDRVALRSAEQRRDVEAERDKLREELGWARAQVAMRTKDAALAHAVIAEQRDELLRLQTALADARTELAIEREVGAEIDRGEIVVPEGRRIAV